MGSPLLTTSEVARTTGDDEAEARPAGLGRVISSNYNELTRFDSSYQAPLVEHVTLDVLLKHHDALTRYHKISPATREAKSLAARTINKQPNFSITNCICLGLGSMAGIFHDSTHTNVSDAKDFDLAPLSQLVAFEFWITILKKRSSIQHVYFQDPQFNAVDKAFLNSLGYEVIDSPASKDLITAETFLYTPYTNMDAIYNTMKGCFPALYIGNDIHYLDFMLVEKPYPWIRSMVEKFLDDREIVDEFVVSTYTPVGRSIKGYMASMYYPRSLSGEGSSQGLRRSERILARNTRVGKSSSC